MPNFITVFGYHIYFWSNENKPIEPVHVHISKNPTSNATKYWINEDGSIEQENNNSQIPNNDLKKLEKVIKLYSDNIVSEWEKFFNTIAIFHDQIQEEQDYDER